MSIFVDTSAWFAAANPEDEYNSRAQQILASGEPLVTTDHVLAETWTLIRNRIHYRAANRFWGELRNGIAHIEPVGLADLEAAWQIGLDWKDQDFSLIDRTSFAVMRRLGIEQAASFDDHFAVFRFGPRLRQAFTVLR